MEVFIIDTTYYKGINLIYKYVQSIFPEVDRRLSDFSAPFKNKEDNILAVQALSSARLKGFHAKGGSVYALYPHTDSKVVVPLIVSFQTISDYLDNLCDRTGVQNEDSFRQLHLSMLDAVDPKIKKSDYYLYYPYKDDSGYLDKLVDECRVQIAKLPSYSLVEDRIKEYISLYSSLQTYKHLDIKERESKLRSWSREHLYKYPELTCWEFSAAAGSTLGIFILFAAASNPSLNFDEVISIDLAYFPWICGLHILLDYYIDLQEDIKSGDLNFTSYYNNLKQCEERISFFIKRSLECCLGLKYSGFHSTIVKGLLAMYLSDPKASFALNRLASGNLVRIGGKDAVLYHKLCKVLRHVGML